RARIFHVHICAFRPTSIVVTLLLIFDASPKPRLPHFHHRHSRRRKSNHLKQPQTANRLHGLPPGIDYSSSADRQRPCYTSDPLRPRDRWRLSDCEREC
ncbi:hypothetical protein B0H14DRAFT_3855059, partial [Mycena olivaceomarginata]